SGSTYLGSLGMVTLSYSRLLVYKLAQGCKATFHSVGLSGPVSDQSLMTQAGRRFPVSRLTETVPSLDPVGVVRPSPTSELRSTHCSTVGLTGRPISPSDPCAWQLAWLRNR
ncbi:hypothetical protein T310_9105, partial [Rasamsonia emersonii CBS 393.64]